jgi:aryl-alcohol dehydrogenase-like predicted oxidoreductase
MTMRTAPLGATGVELSRVGLGTWQMGGPGSPRGWGDQDDALSVRTIHHAVTRGVNWLDTAPAYGVGHAQEVVGRALAELGPEERPYVFTKCGIGWKPGETTYARDLSPEAVRRECEGSLRTLGAERLDLLQLHWPVEEPGAIEQAWATLAGLADAGHVRWIGVSNFDVGQLDRCQAIRPVDTVQPALSLLDRGNAADVLPWCAQHGAAALVYSPLQSGLLTGTFSRARLRPGDWRVEGRNMRDAGHSHFHDPWLAQNLDLVELLRPVAARLGCTVLALAIAWTLAWPGVTAAIVGARDPEQVDGWLPAAEVQLGPEDLDEIAAALAATGAGLGGPATVRP